jgi:hypothetical protein
MKIHYVKIDGSTFIVWVLSSTVGLPLALIKVATITCTLTNSWQQHLTVEVGGGTLLSRPYQAAAFSFIRRDFVPDSMCPSAGFHIRWS